MRLASQGEIAERRFLEMLYGCPCLLLLLILLLLILLLLLLILLLLLLLLVLLNTTGISQQEEEERWGSIGFDVKRGFDSSLEAPFGPFGKTSYSFLTSSFNSKTPFLDISGIAKPKTLHSVLVTLRQCFLVSTFTF